jgi:hypothetical protein
MDCTLYFQFLRIFTTGFDLWRGARTRSLKVVLESERMKEPRVPRFVTFAEARAHFLGTFRFMILQLGRRNKAMVRLSFQPQKIRHCPVDRTIDFLYSLNSWLTRATPDNECRLVVLWAEPNAVQDVENGDHRAEQGQVDDQRRHRDERH